MYICRLIEELTAFLYFLEDYSQLSKTLMGAPNSKERMNTALDILMSTQQFPDRKDIETAMNAFFGMLIIGEQYKPAATYSGDITLLRARSHTLGSDSLAEDYNIHEVCGLALSLYNIYFIIL